MSLSGDISVPQCQRCGSQWGHRRQARLGHSGYSISIKLSAGIGSTGRQRADIRAHARDQGYAADARSDDSLAGRHWFQAQKNKG